MTIVAGLLGADFVVLGSDSEETRSVGKARVRKILTVTKGAPPECKCLIGGAGNGQFIELAVQQLDKALVAPFTLATVSQTIEDVLNSVHCDRIERFLPAAQRADASFQLLCAIWVSGQGVSLVSVGRGFNVVVREPCAIGWGEYLADYLFANFHLSGMDLRRSTRLVTYVISQVAKHAQYCGGPSQIMTLTADGMVDEMTVVKDWDERSCGIAMEEAAYILNFLDPVGADFQLDRIDDVVDKISITLKRKFHAAFDDLAPKVRAFIEERAAAKAGNQAGDDHPSATTAPAPEQ